MVARSCSAARPANAKWSSCARPRPRRPASARACCSARSCPLCPEAIVLQPDPVRTAAVLEALLGGAAAGEPGGRADGRGRLSVPGPARPARPCTATCRSSSARSGPRCRSLLRPRLGFGGGQVRRGDGGPHRPAGRIARWCRPAETRAFLAPLGGASPDAARAGGPAAAGAARPAHHWRPGGAAVQRRAGRVRPPGAHAWRLAHGKDAEPVDRPTGH